jgi:hypothetical protein
MNEDWRLDRQKIFTGSSYSEERHNTHVNG